MRKLLRTLPLSIVLVLIGCEASPVPLSAPGDAAIRSELLGNWHTVDEDGAELSLDVIAFNEFEYLAVVETPDEEPPSLFRLYETDVEGTVFVNVQCLNCDEDGQEYVFGRLRVENGVLVTPWLDHDFYELTEGAASPDEALHALTQAIRDNRAVFSESWEWLRGKE